MTNKINTKVNIGGIEIKNPVLTASGTFGYGSEFHELIDLNMLGAIVVKGISLLPSKGNPPPRIVETSCGMLNAIGLENIGINEFVNKKLPFLTSINTPVIVNIYGKNIDEYVALAEIINDFDGISGIEVNISCPNVKKGGIAFGVDVQSAFEVVKAVRVKTSKLLIVKLSPNVTDISKIAVSVEKAGADSISLINTITGMAIDINTKRPKLANITGGLSGPAIKPVALKMVWEVANSVNIPVIGIGGIVIPADAIEFLIAGASAIQVGTANFINPNASIDIINGIESYLIQNNIDDVSDLIGSIKI